MNRRQRRRKLISPKFTQITPDGKRIRHYSFPKDNFKFTQRVNSLIKKYENAKYIVDFKGDMISQERIDNLVKSLNIKEKIDE